MGLEMQMMALSFRPVTLKGGWLESQETLVQQKKVKDNEKLGRHGCQTAAGEDQSQQRFFQTSWGTWWSHERPEQRLSRMLNASIVRLPEFTACSARTRAREGEGRKAQDVLEGRDEFTAKATPEKASLPLLLGACWQKTDFQRNSARFLTTASSPEWAKVSVSAQELTSCRLPPFPPSPPQKHHLQPLLFYPSPCQITTTQYGGA